MSYQALQTHEYGLASEEHPPQYNGSQQHELAGKGRHVTVDLNVPVQRLAVEAAGSGLPNLGSVANYVHLSDVGDIVQTVLHVDTDLAPLYGRFNTEEEHRAAPNVYLSADNIEVDIYLSGSKKANIEITGKERARFGTTFVRIIHKNGDSSTPFSVTVNKPAKNSCLVSVPASFSGSITGACSLTGSIRDEATCLVADAAKSRWTVQQRLGNPPINHGSLYPPNISTGSQSVSAPGLHHSSVIFETLPASQQPGHDFTPQRERRHVVFFEDWPRGLQAIDASAAASRRQIYKAYYWYFGASAGWLVFLTLVVHVLDAEAAAVYAFGGFMWFISLMFPFLVFMNTYEELFYRRPRRALAV